MSATNFKTENNTYRKLIGNGLTYRIPRFQRDYSWTEEEWEDLWFDILGTLSEGGEPAHYMGYLVLQSKDEKSFDVIDGQQRLTTLTLLVLAVLKNLNRLVEEGKNPDQNSRRLEQIRNTYIGYLDPVTLITRAKLTLNRNNDEYFQTNLLPLVKSLPIRGFRASVHSLRKAFEWFEKRVYEYAKTRDGDEGVELASLVETMSDRLFFTVISVTDELNAYKVFETLNARGVRLSSTDLLKNYLFSILHKENQSPSHEMEVLEERWESIVSRLGSEKFPDFLRTHWNSRKPLVRHAELFKKIRAEVKDRATVFELLRGMEEDIDTYLALTNPEASHLNRKFKDYAQQLRMFRVRQPFSFLLAAHRALPEEAFKKVLRGCVMIAFRYNVIGAQPPGEQERVYDSATQKLNQHPTVSTPQLFEYLRAIYPQDSQFKVNFSEKIVRTTDSRNNKVLRYILCELERHYSGHDYDFESDTFNIEHVLPKHPESGWEQFTDHEVEAMIYRIGNMVLLAKGENKTIGNTTYNRKRPVLQASEFGLTRKLAETNAEWTPERIAKRQEKLAELATSIWRIDQLS